MEKRDIIRLNKIVDYCEDVADVLKSFGNDMEVFYKSELFQKVIAFDIFQIGELVATLTDGFKKSNPTIPWVKIKGMRNTIVHHYGSIDYEVLWETANVDVPRLRDYCRKVVEKAENP